MLGPLCKEENKAILLTHTYGGRLTWAFLRDDSFEIIIQEIYLMIIWAPCRSFNLHVNSRFTSLSDNFDQISPFTPSLTSVNKKFQMVNNTKGISPQAHRIKRCCHIKRKAQENVLKMKGEKTQLIG